MAGAGIHTSRKPFLYAWMSGPTIPLLNSAQYLGWPHERLRGEAYDAFIRRVRTRSSVFPQALLQWEDRKGQCAYSQPASPPDSLV